MISFNHQVFFEVARQLSFSKAAHTLYISQPAVSKHIKTLEESYEAPLFERTGHVISLTPQGKVLLDYLKKATDLERSLKFDITSIADKKQAQGSLVIGASTTVALYVIPKILSEFHQQYPSILLRLVNRNSENIMKALMEHEIDFAIIEGQQKLNTARYKFFMTDEVLPVCSARSELAKSKKLTIEQLPGLPVAIREQGSGTWTAVSSALEKNGISIQDFKSRIVLGGTEALKNFILNDTCFGFLPLRSVEKELKNGTLVRLQIPGLEIHREFYFVQRPGSENDRINKLFIKTAQQFYNKK